MKILLIKNGQVGWELQRSLSTLGEVVAVDYFDKELCGDLTNLEGIAQTVRQVKPDVIVNAAAHTAVDKAESERELSDLLNDKGVAVLAEESAKLGALMVHYSTDYVFDGREHYRQEDEDRAAERLAKPNAPEKLRWSREPAPSDFPHQLVKPWRTFKTMLRLAVRKRRCRSLTISTARRPGRAAGGLHHRHRKLQ
jgi:nucleoside-diphosphate-sugar epimerase